MHLQNLEIMSKHEYNVKIEWLSDRKGKMYSDELHDHEASLSNEIEVATPPQFPGGIPHVWTPEHLFTSAVSSCLMTTFLAIASHSKLEFVSFNCHSKGVLEKVDGKVMMSEIQLYPVLVIEDELQMDKAQKILEKAKKACLISNSVKSEVNMFPKVSMLEVRN